MAILDAAGATSLCRHPSPAAYSRSQINCPHVPRRPTQGWPEVQRPGGLQLALRPCHPRGPANRSSRRVRRPVAGDRVPAGGDDEGWGDSGRHPIDPPFAAPARATNDDHAMARSCMAPDDKTAEGRVEATCRRSSPRTRPPTSYATASQVSDDYDSESCAFTGMVIWVPDQPRRGRCESRPPHHAGGATPGCNGPPVEPARKALRHTAP